MGSRLDRRGAEQPRRRRRLFVQHAENTEEYVGPVERERPAVEGEGAVRRAAQPVGEPRLLECSAHLLVLALETDP